MTLRDCAKSGIVFVLYCFFRVYPEGLFLGCQSRAYKSLLINHPLSRNSAFINNVCKGIEQPHAVAQDSILLFSPIRRQMACVPASMAGSEPTEELERVLQELKDLLGSEPFSKTTPMHLAECYLYWVAQAEALTKMGSLLHDQRERVRACSLIMTSFSPGVVGDWPRFPLMRW